MRGPLPCAPVDRAGARWRPPRAGSTQRHLAPPVDATPTFFPRRRRVEAARRDGCVPWGARSENGRGRRGSGERNGRRAARRPPESSESWCPRAVCALGCCSAAGRLCELHAGCRHPAAASDPLPSPRPPASLAGEYAEPGGGEKGQRGGAGGGDGAKAKREKKRSKIEVLDK